MSGESTESLLEVLKCCHSKNIGLVVDHIEMIHSDAFTLVLCSINDYNGPLATLNGLAAESADVLLAIESLEISIKENIIFNDGEKLRRCQASIYQKVCFESAFSTAFIMDLFCLPIPLHNVSDHHISIRCKPDWCKNELFITGSGIYIIRDRWAIRHLAAHNSQYIHDVNGDVEIVHDNLQEVVELLRHLEASPSLPLPFPLLQIVAYSYLRPLAFYHWLWIEPCKACPEEKHSGSWLCQPACTICTEPFASKEVPIPFYYPSSVPGCEHNEWVGLVLCSQCARYIEPALLASGWRSVKFSELPFCMARLKHDDCMIHAPSRYHPLFSRCLVKSGSPSQCESAWEKRPDPISYRLLLMRRCESEGPDIVQRHLYRARRCRYCACMQNRCSLCFSELKVARSIPGFSNVIVGTSCCIGLVAPPKGEIDMTVSCCPDLDGCFYRQLSRIFDNSLIVSIIESYAALL